MAGGGQQFSLNLTYLPKYSKMFRNGLSHLSTPSGLILAASKVKGGIAKYIGNPQYYQKIFNFRLNWSILELSKKLIFFAYFRVFTISRGYFRAKMQISKIAAFTF